MGNLQCLNCFKSYDEIDQNQNVAQNEKLSEIKFLEDADVISHFDLQQIQLQSRNKDQNSRRSLVVMAAKKPEYRSQSLRILSRRQHPRYSINIPKTDHLKEGKNDMFGSQETNLPKLFENDSNERKGKEKNDEKDTKREIEEVLAVLDSPLETSMNLKTPVKNDGMLRDKSVVSSDSKKHVDEDKDEVIPLKKSVRILGKKGKIGGEKKSVKSMSIGASSYSFKSCNEFDNLTFASLVSSGTTLKRFGTSVSKKELFQELMFEIERFSEYFNFSAQLPLEEILFDKSNINGSSEKKLITFCPQLTELPTKHGGTTRRRIIVSRGSLIKNQSFKEYQISSNKKIEGNTSRYLQKRLVNFGDFDNELDALVNYSILTGNPLPETLHTFRMATGKKFPNGKQIFYEFERSINLQEFFTQIGEGSIVDLKTYLIKKLSKIEILNDNFIKIDFYSEYYFPETMKISQIRTTLKSLLSI